MIKKLRWKFIRVTMLAVLAVLLTIIAAINAVNVWQSNAALDSVTELLMRNGGTFPMIMEPGPPGGGGRENRGFKTDGMGRFHDKELPFATRFFTVSFDEAGNVLRCDLNSIASVTREDAEQIAGAILRRGRELGWYQSYRYRLVRSPSATMVIVLESTVVRGSLRSVLFITLTVGLAALLAVFILIVGLSGKVIRPIAETYEKQRRFITDASHELKTPLTVISANAEVLGLTAGESEWSDGILRQCERMRVLIGKMIQMSRLDEGEQRLVFTDFDLSEAVYDTAMSFRSPASFRGLTLEAEVQPEIRFHGDEGSMRQLVSILVDNAVKYCDAGGRIRVTLERESRAIGRERIRLRVVNHFSGVKDLDTDKVFERFYRADAAHTEGSSYGLGLPIAASIAEQHGGRVTARKLPPDQVEFSAVF